MQWIKIYEVTSSGKKNIPIKACQIVLCTQKKSYIFKLNLHTHSYYLPIQVTEQQWWHWVIKYPIIKNMKKQNKNYSTKRRMSYHINRININVYVYTYICMCLYLFCFDISEVEMKIIKKNAFTMCI